MPASGNATRARNGAYCHPRRRTASRASSRTISPVQPRCASPSASGQAAGDRSCQHRRRRYGRRPPCLFGTAEAGARGGRRNAGGRTHLPPVAMAWRAIETTLTVGDGASLDWLPQETILFDRSALTPDALSPTSHPNGTPAGGGSDRARPHRHGRNAPEAWRFPMPGASDAAAKLVFADGTPLRRRRRRDHGRTAPPATARRRSPRSSSSRPTRKRRSTRPATRSPVARGEAGVSAWNGMLVAALDCADRADAARRSHPLDRSAARRADAARLALLRNAR